MPTRRVNALLAVVTMLHSNDNVVEEHALGVEAVAREEREVLLLLIRRTEELQRLHLMGNVYL